MRAFLLFFSFIPYSSFTILRGVEVFGLSLLCHLFSNFCQKISIQREHLLRYYASVRGVALAGHLRPNLWHVSNGFYVGTQHGDAILIVGNENRTATAHWRRFSTNLVSALTPGLVRVGRDLVGLRDGDIIQCGFHLLGDLSLPLRWRESVPGALCINSF
jgi:hypothetical protein